MYFSQRHFDQLNPRQGPPMASILEYDDIWREVADALYDAGEYAEAFRYYKALQELDVKDPDYILALATCHAALGNQADALVILEAAAAEHRGSIPIHLKLVKLYEEAGRKREAVELAHKVTRLRSRQRTMPGYIINDRMKQPDTGEVIMDARKRSRGSYLKEAPLNRQQILEQGQVRYMAMQEIFEQLLLVQDGMDEGDTAATEEWMRLAEQLIDDFRSMSCFYPPREKWRFAGYRMTWATEAEVRVVMDEQGYDTDDLPTSLHGISFDTWIDIFCRSALTHAKNGLKSKCEDIIKSGMEANICYQEPARLDQLHACYLACGIALSDEEIIYTASRYFFKTYPFTEDAYRIFNASTRLYDGTRSWYNSGPSQKVILRAIKEMDYALMNSKEREAYEFSAVERNVYTKSGTDMEANAHGLTEMSPALLTTYAHVLAAGGAYPSALNYYFRAWTLQPDDPSLNLSIASAYIHHGMKRQSENRQYLVQQGLAFLLRYRRARGSEDAPAIHAQEAEFNVGRMMSLLGLQHLAIECFERCLDLSSKVHAEAELREASGEEDLVREDFASQAAFSLQNIAAIAGDVDQARKITKEWLVI
jgi:general transcription factor 3C polypeptide 3 (transcription factor C subunit 4)